MVEYLMCGRYVFQPQKDFGLRFELEDNLILKPNYNVSPGQFQPVITQNIKKKVSEKRWGLVPSWSKDPKIGFRLINARGETVNQKPSFRKAFKYQRCLIPANGFFEWQTLANKSKIPFYFFLDDKSIFAFAGLYETWHNPQGGELSTYTIITTEPNDLVKTVHDRMPVILPKNLESAWLDPKTSETDLLSFLKPFPDQHMSYYKVSDRLNKSSENDPHLIHQVK